MTTQNAAPDAANPTCSALCSRSTPLASPTIAAKRGCCRRVWSASSLTSSRSRSAPCTSRRTRRKYRSELSRAWRRHLTRRRCYGRSTPSSQYDTKGANQPGLTHGSPKQTADRDSRVGALIDAGLGARRDRVAPTRDLQRRTTSSDLAPGEPRFTDLLRSKHKWCAYQSVLCTAADLSRSHYHRTKRQFGHVSVRRPLLVV